MVLGTFDSVALVGDSRLQFLSGAVQPVMASSDGTILVGSARVVSSNIPTKNGVVHIINSVLTDDASINATAVAVAAKLGDFGPFNRTKASFTLFCLSPSLFFSSNCSSCVQVAMQQKHDHLC